MIVDFNWPTDIYKMAFPYFRQNHKKIRLTWIKTLIIPRGKHFLCLIQAVVNTRDTP